MNKLNVKIEHISHSGFTIETENIFLVFDYYKGDISLKDKKTLVFVSHGHGDHFNPDIFKWQNTRKDIEYILSSDIVLPSLDSNIHIVRPYEQLTLDMVNIKTFGSTDLGVSFLINVDNINIFHGGDLNWWYWEEDTVEEKLRMEKAFKEEIGRIKVENIHIAMFPVDPRLEDYFHLGGEYFIKEISPKYFIPMHFGDKYYVISKFIHRIGKFNTSVVEFAEKNRIISV